MMKTFSKFSSVRRCVSLFSTNKVHCNANSLFQKGNEFIFKRDSKNAIECFKKALNEPIENEKLKNDILLQLATIFYKISNLEEAEKYLKMIGGDYGQKRFLSVFITAKKGNFEEANEMIEKCKPISPEDIFDWSVFLRELAVIFMDFQKWDDAIKYLNESHELLSKCGKDLEVQLLLKKVISNLIYIYQKKTDWKKVIEYYKILLDIEYQISGPVSMQAINILIDLAHYQISHYPTELEEGFQNSEKVKITLLEILKIRQIQSIIERLIAIYRIQIKYFNQKKKVEKSIELYKSAIQLAEEHNLLIHQIDLLLNMSTLYIQRDKYEFLKIMEKVKQLLPKVETSEKDLLESAFHFYMGTYCMTQRDWVSATNHFEDTLNIYSKIYPPKHFKIKRIHFDLLNCYSANKDTSNMEKHIQLLTNLATPIELLPYKYLLVENYRLNKEFDKAKLLVEQMLNEYKNFDDQKEKLQTILSKIENEKKHKF